MGTIEKLMTVALWAFGTCHSQTADTKPVTVDFADHYHHVLHNGRVPLSSVYRLPEKIVALPLAASYHREDLSGGHRPVSTHARVHISPPKIAEPSGVHLAPEGPLHAPHQISLVHHHAVHVVHAALRGEAPIVVHVAPTNHDIDHSRFASYEPRSAAILAHVDSSEPVIVRGSRLTKDQTV
ncbi:uncharacterized protein LOC111259595 [Varroa jacobsoni]|uniref:uncharacterized protein LOC111259595 n=1 Tax=Varroa jacobsoni TaxID=62625 RepID=UPI000BF99DEC|nr:uncharacterized protein LOC111259595 [Varroa jacobsoni]